MPAPTRPLPSGWEWRQIRGLCAEKTGTRNPADQPEASFQYIDIGSVDNQQKVIRTAKTIIGREAPSRARKVVQKDDVIVSTTRPNLNAVALVPESLDDQICSTGFCVLRAGAELNPRYLFCWTRSPEFVEALTNLVKGGLYPAISDAQVMNQYIPWAPPAVQEKVASSLLQRIEHVQQMRAAVQAQLVSIDELPSILIQEAFSKNE